MSEKHVHEESEDDDDYSPTKNENDEEQSDATDESEQDANESVEEKKETDNDVKPYDESKTNQLWETFTRSSSSENSKAPAIVDTPKPPTKVFDFAGEKVSVPVPTPPSLKRPAAAPSNSVLDRLGIGKKQKISTLEKSRLDWSAHKESASLNEDLDSHRRGKDSYVERQAFLQRSELREHDHYLAHVKKK